MSNRQTELFLDTYRRLETVAEGILPQNGRGSVIARLARLPELAPYREELECCREVRNLLSHEIKVDGDYPITPGEGLQRFLEGLIERLENPPRLSSVMTTVEHLLTFSLDDSVLSRMREMTERNLSRIPLMQNGRVEGMFSIDTVFWACLDGIYISEETTFSDIASFLPIAGQPWQPYRFVPSHMTVEAAEQTFNASTRKNKKVKLLLVTRSGSAKDKLLGVVSPYDLLKQ